MELIGIKEEKIKIKRTIFNMEPRIEKTTKIARNLDSGATQVQQMQTLLLTLLRLEAMQANAYDRWQPFFNQGRLDFPGILAYLNVFHDDNQTLNKLEKYFQNRKRINTQETYIKWKNYGNELMEEVRGKIYSLQLTV